MSRPTPTPSPSSTNPPTPSPPSVSTTSSATVATPTSSAASPTSTTTNAATSTSASASAATSATSTTTSSLSSSTTTATTSLSVAPTQPVPSDGGQAVTTFVIATPTPTAQNTSSSSHSFFSNTGAVAGVFSVVGIVVLGFVIALIINCIRRRRAQKFDRDVAEAAAEAAASSRSPFDDYSYNNNNSGGNNGGGGPGGGGGGGGYGYSDGSHGTYQLPPLSPPNDHYGASEMSQYDPYAAGAASLAASAVGRTRSRKESEPGTPGIAGVGAGTLAREPSKRAPYHAFAGPGLQPHELQPNNGSFRNRRSNQDVLEAAGLAGVIGVGATTVAASNNNFNNGASAYVTRRTSETAQTTLSGRSQFGSLSSGGHHPPALQPGFPVDSYYPQRHDSLSPDPFAAAYPLTVPQPSKPLPNPHDTNSPTQSLPAEQNEHEEVVETGSPTPLRSDEQRMSYQDDTDYSQGNRVLRVANE